EISGRTAWADSYVLFVLFLRDRDIVMMGSGRYIDRLEQRDGEWKIAERRTVTEMRIETDGRGFFNAPGGYQAGVWGKGDLSYQRPLTLPGVETPSILTSSGEASVATIGNADL